MPNEKTPMEQLISDLRQLPEPDNRFTRKIIEGIILRAETLLPFQRPGRRGGEEGKERIL